MNAKRRSESILPEGTERKADAWVMMKAAASRINRDRATVYRWVKAGKIRVWRPKRELWLYLPDLLKAEEDSVRRVKIDESNGCD